MCAAATADPKGLKRICPNCGTRYYDLNKRPIACPSCATEFKGETKTKGRRGRLPVANDAGKAASIAARPVADEEVAAGGEEGDETISLEEVEETEEVEEDEDIDAIDPDLAIEAVETEDIDEDEEDAVLEDVPDEE